MFYLTHYNNKSPHLVVAPVTYTDDESNCCWCYIITFLFRLFLILLDSYFLLFNR